MPCRGYRGGDEPQWPEEESLMDVDYQEQAAYQSAAPRRSRAQVPPRPSTFLPVSVSECCAAAVPRPGSPQALWLSSCLPVYQEQAAYQIAAPRRPLAQVSPRPSSSQPVFTQLAVRSERRPSACRHVVDWMQEAAAGCAVNVDAESL